MDYEHEGPDGAGAPAPRAATLVLNKVDGSAAQRATERQFSRDRIAQRVALPADHQLRTMLDSGTFSLAGLGHSTRVPIKRLGLAVASQLM